MERYSDCGVARLTRRVNQVYGGPPMQQMMIIDDNVYDSPITSVGDSDDATVDLTDTDAQPTTEGINFPCDNIGYYTSNTDDHYPNHQTEVVHKEGDANMRRSVD